MTEVIFRSDLKNGERVVQGKGLSRDSISLGERIESHASVLGVNGFFIFTGVPGVKAPIEIDAEQILRNLVLNNQVICGTVNAGLPLLRKGCSIWCRSCGASLPPFAL